MALDTNIVHEETGATAVVSEKAYELVWKDKGWNKVTPAEAVEASNKRREAMVAEQQANADAAAKTMTAAFADVGVDAAASGLVPEESPKGKKASGSGSGGSGGSSGSGSGSSS